MQVIRELQQKAGPVAATALTIGNFDGLHLGHQALIAKLLQEGRARGLETVVFTFDPHPVQVLFPEKNLKRLFSVDDLIRRLTVIGVGHLVLQAFSRDFSQLHAAAFLEKFIVKPFNPKLLVVGYDFAFGAGREGTLEVLKEFCKVRGIDLSVVPPVMLNGQPISSTRIRESLERGEVEIAHAALGRPFYLEGTVVKGAGRGRQLGFPTANLQARGETKPHVGVYWTRLWVGDKSYWGVTNVGYNPTFNTTQVGDPLKVETHLLDQQLDLYGLTVRLEFFGFLRGEKKFNGPDELKKQIALDILEAQERVGRLDDKMG